MQTRLLHEGEELDLVCFQVYGFTDGAVEAVLRENPEAMEYIDNFGRIIFLERPLTIRLPEVKRPQQMLSVTRLFD